MEKLLIVDDDAALRRLMRLELSDTYEVIDSGEPEQGLALALESKPNKRDRRNSPARGHNKAGHRSRRSQ